MARALEAPDAQPQKPKAPAVKLFRGTESHRSPTSE
jgi:hypothetical protein